MFKYCTILFLVAWSSWASEPRTCAELFQNIVTVRAEADFLHYANSKLHMTHQVDILQAKKKLLNLTSSHRPREKIQDWLVLFDSKLNSAGENPLYLKKIKTILINKYVIKDADIPESYFKFQKRLARERGHGDIELTREMRIELIKTLKEDQKSSLEKWIDYFVSKDSDVYPGWFKYWSFVEMAKLSRFNQETNSFVKRSRDSVAPFIELNREALAVIYDSLSKKIDPKTEDQILNLSDAKFLELMKKHSKNFDILYAHILMKQKEILSDLNKVEGGWIKYEMGSDHRPLYKSLQSQNTGWCTAGEETARKQLSRGDFYVYYSLDENQKMTKPRIAIRMLENSIEEIRGIGPSQELDSIIAESDILSNKLKEFGEEGKYYLEKDQDMKRLTEIDKKAIRGEELSIDDLSFIYQANKKIKGFGYDEPRIKKIISKRNLKEDLSKVFNVGVDEISLTLDEALSGKYKLHYGDLEFSNGNMEGVKLPEYLVGSLWLYSSNPPNEFVSPKVVVGDVVLWNYVLNKEFVMPKKIIGNADVGNLFSIDKLIMPEVLVGDLFLKGPEVLYISSLSKALDKIKDIFSLKTSNKKLPNIFRGKIKFRSME